MAVAFVMVCAVMVLFPGITNAASAELNLTGYVTQVFDPVGAFSSSVSVGMPIAGRVTFDLAAQDANPNPGIGDYWFTTSPYGMTLSIGALTFQTDPRAVNFRLTLADRIQADDDYVFISYNNQPLRDGFPIDIIRWALVDPSGNALSNTLMPRSAPILQNWTQPIGIEISHSELTGDPGTFYLYGQVQSVEFVPEPSSVALAAVGLLGLGIHNFSRRMQRSR